MSQYLEKCQKMLQNLDNLTKSKKMSQYPDKCQKFWKNELEK